MGVALGLALLAGIAATTTAQTGDPATVEALVTGYSTALLVAAGLLAVAAVVALLTLRARPILEHDDVHTPEDAAVAGDREPA
jgi:hypothetical protein